MEPIDKKSLTERDICTKFITPALQQADWDLMTQVREEVAFTNGEATKHVWYYEHPYPPGYKSYSKTKPIRIEEFAAEKKWWGKPDARGGCKGRKGNEFAWKVPVEQIKDSGYNLDIKNPHDADTGPGDPDELLKDFKRLLGEVDKARNALRDELAAALDRSR